MPYNDQYQKLQTYKLMATVWTDDSNKTLVLFNIKIVPFELHAPMTIILNIILTPLWSVLEHAIFSKFFVVYFFTFIERFISSMFVFRKVCMILLESHLLMVPKGVFCCWETGGMDKPLNKFVKPGILKTQCFLLKNTMFFKSRV